MNVTFASGQRRWFVRPRERETVMPGPNVALAQTVDLLARFRESLRCAIVSGVERTRCAQQAGARSATIKHHATALSPASTRSVRVLPGASSR